MYIQEYIYTSGECWKKTWLQITRACMYRKVKQRNLDKQANVCNEWKLVFLLGWSLKWGLIVNQTVYNMIDLKCSLKNTNCCPPDFSDIYTNYNIEWFVILVNGLTTRRIISACLINNKILLKRVYGNRNCRFSQLFTLKYFNNC